MVKDNELERPLNPGLEAVCLEGLKCFLCETEGTFFPLNCLNVTSHIYKKVYLDSDYELLECMALSCAELFSLVFDLHIDYKFSTFTIPFVYVKCICADKNLYFLRMPLPPVIYSFNIN